ncbi:hypothetical protein PLEOSDRAFT_157663 [Pleurotus ostreatus PC15]|uniref:Uncharacterized protein n=1 Tax=Pleurotus ostreatus (strain PC15) TaxID=1137138 RepID=A0A067NKN4_PLEO1|nr:hypothetical protein PLEOSDRAFT_157663 [Pleurotus ostreatus PC15]
MLPAPIVVALQLPFRDLFPPNNSQLPTPNFQLPPSNSQLPPSNSNSQLPTPTPTSNFQLSASSFSTSPCRRPTIAQCTYAFTHDIPQYQNPSKSISLEIKISQSSKAFELRI